MSLSDGARKVQLYAGAIGAVIATGAALYTYSPWPWNDEFQEVASISYQTAINQRWDILFLIQQRIREAERRGDQQAIIELRRQEQRLQAEIKDLELRQQKINR